MPLLASYGLPVAPIHRIEKHRLDGRNVRVVVADWQSGERGTNWPVLEPHLASDFARVTGEPSLRKFNGRFGLLGYHRLHDAEMLHRKETWRGDPVLWALAHADVAAGILRAVDIINEVRSGKQKLNDRTIPFLLRTLLSEFRRMGLKAVFEGKPRHFTCFVWRPPEAVVSRRDFLLRKTFSSLWATDPIGTAYHVLSWVLNQYIRRVRFEFVSVDYERRFFGMTGSEPPRFGLELRWDALLEVIYWKLAESVGGGFRQCRRCGRIFPMDTGKDLYCNERCCDAFRSKKHRDKKRREKAEAESAKKPG
jgi:hypothetical protein